MKFNTLKRRPLAVAVSATVALAAFGAGQTLAAPDGSAVAPANSSGHVVANPLNTGTTRYIVRFAEEPLARHNNPSAGNGAASAASGVGAIPTKKMRNGRSRMDVNSAPAKAYVGFLKDKQQQHLADMSQALGHAPVVRLQMQHALNAAVVELSRADVAKVLKVPGVVAVEPDRAMPLATDLGPGFIGAASIWWGASAGQDSMFASGFDGLPPFRGDGMVIGDIDTGYNSESPSFSATDSAGYTITNPLGSGVYLPSSQCNLPTISLAGCNDKVIGVYDMINLTGNGPPFSVEDTQGHGSHTASTAAGNARSATLAGYTAPISGVAPHANLVIYYACSPDPNVQCSTAATTASVNQAIADGVVDALNYSISGGTDPWGDSTSQAFLAAADAGIFVAAAAGNTNSSVPNQVPGTANHLEPWVTTVAAGTHTGGPIAPDLSVTGPGTPPANVQNIPLNEGSGDTPPTATITAPLNLSPAFHISNTSGSDGCAGYPAGQFTNAVALVSRGTCTFITKVNNAVAAGAIAVLISDNRVEAQLLPSVPGATVPVYGLTQAQGGALQAWLSTNSNTAPSVIPYPPIRQPAQPDVLANFSLLGPSWFDVVKPDVQGPGVSILAAFNNDGSPNGADNVGLDSGTSMATPHTTGSGALLMGLHPDWTPLEVKSALMMSAKEAGLTKANGVTPSDPFDRGAGRLQDFQASQVGLVLDENATNFGNANPNGGSFPSNGLNLASLQDGICITVDPTLTSSTVTCTLNRNLQSTQGTDVTWTPAFTGVSGSTNPPSILVPANGSAPVAITVDASAFPSDGSFHFGEMTLTADNPSLATLHLPIAVSVPAPAIAVTPSPLLINIPAATTSKSHVLTVTNIGGPTLDVSNTNDTTTASTRYVVIDQASQGNYGFYSDLFPDFGHGFYAADDFVTLGSSTNLTKLSFPGFMTGPTPLSGFAGANIHFEIYANAAGVPAGNPETVAPSYVWSYVAKIGSTPGLSVAGATISIDLVAAGATPTALPPGAYWMVVWPEINYASGAWAWYESVTGLYSNAQNIDPGLLDPVHDTGAWTDNTLSGNFPGMAMHIEENVACGAPWLTTSPSSLSLDGLLSGSVTVTANSTLFPSGATAQTAFLCLDSNDAKNPVFPVPVTAIQR